MPPIPSSKEEKSQLMPIDNQSEFFMEPKEVAEGIILEEVSITVEISEKVDKSLEECNGVVQDWLLKIIPPIKDHQYHGAFILHDFEDSFLQEENTQDESLQFFKFISLTLVHGHNESMIRH